MQAGGAAAGAGPAPVQAAPLLEECLSAAQAALGRAVAAYEGFERGRDVVVRAAAEEATCALARVDWGA